MAVGLEIFINNMPIEGLDDSPEPLIINLPSSAELIVIAGRKHIKFVSISNPPSGSYKVTNLYVNPAGKLVYEFDDGS